MDRLTFKRGVGQRNAVSLNRKGGNRYLFSWMYVRKYYQYPSNFLRVAACTFEWLPTCD